VTVFLFHDGIEPVQILKARYVASDRCDVFTDKGCGLLQLFLSSASDYDVRTFFHEALGCRQANPAVSACDYRNFSRQFLSVVLVHMFFPICFSLFFMLNLRYPSKTDIVIEFAEFEPGFDVFPGFGKPAQLFGKERKCFGIAVRSAFFHESRPNLDFPWRARGLGMGLNPFEHFPVTFAGCQFLQQDIGIETKKLHQALVGRGIVYVLAVFLRESCPALVEHAGQNHIVAQTNAKAPGRALSQVHKVMLRFHFIIDIATCAFASLVANAGL
jgi:hypothetical protein